MRRWGGRWVEIRGRGSERATLDRQIGSWVWISTLKSVD